MTDLGDKFQTQEVRNGDIEFVVDGVCLVIKCLVVDLR